MKFGAGHPEYLKYLRFCGLVVRIGQGNTIPIADIREYGLDGLWKAAVAKAITATAKSTGVPEAFASGWTGAFPGCPNADGKIVGMIYRMERLQAFETIGREYFRQFQN